MECLLKNVPPRFLLAFILGAVVHKYCFRNAEFRMNGERQNEWGMNTIFSFQNIFPHSLLKRMGKMAFYKYSVKQMK